MTSIPWHALFGAILDQIRREISFKGITITSLHIYMQKLAWWFSYCRLFFNLIFFNLSASFKSKLLSPNRLRVLDLVFFIYICIRQPSTSMETSLMVWDFCFILEKISYHAWQLSYLIEIAVFLARIVHCILKDL